MKFHFADGMHRQRTREGQSECMRHRRGPIIPILRRIAVAVALALILGYILKAEQPASYLPAVGNGRYGPTEHFRWPMEFSLKDTVATRLKVV